MPGATLETMGGSEMNLITALKALDEGDKIRRKTWTAIEYVQLDKDRKIVDDLGQEVFFLCTSDDIGTDCWEVIEKPPLTDQEREYLKTVVKPFRDRVHYICKIKITNSDNQFIFIRVKRYDCEENEPKSTKYEDIDLPYFKKNTMYKNMEVDKKYTLEELGL